MKKKGEILVENIIFIVLNLIFLSVLILFLFRQGSGVVALEQSYAKQIALIVDSSKPFMEISLNMEKAFELAKKNGIDPVDIVNIKGNLVTVKLSENSGYSYSFFNNVEAASFPSGEDYIFTINKNDS